MPAPFSHLILFLISLILLLLLTKGNQGLQTKLMAERPFDLYDVHVLGSGKGQLL